MNPSGPYHSNGACLYGERATPSGQLLDVRSYKDRSREAHYFRLGLMISTVTPIGDRGHKVFSNVRRFIVIEARNNLFCVCVPVTTYGNQGCKKKGINVQDHVIVADSRKEAQQLVGEPLLEKRPIFVDLFDSRDTLRPASRVNLRSPTTIHYNLAIRLLGQVHPHYIPRLKQYLPNFGFDREEHTDYHLISSNQSQH
ncbi:hypothetical protein VTN00DRAFT_6698 [Thermoascus crustaceus]|uniref:uncharacterized protein n=1 Tax=Thermoascus crustaceus TaxID=5088 RepID=UPI003744A34F